MEDEVSTAEVAQGVGFFACASGHYALFYGQKDCVMKVNRSLLLLCCLPVGCALLRAAPGQYLTPACTEAAPYTFADVTEDSFNVLISGLDSWGTIDQGGLSDVNMVMTVNPTTRSILLTSIPRDSYIPLHSYGARDKLTHSGLYGEEETKATIEDFLGIDINYTIRVNFSMLCDIIDAVDGIRVYNDIDFYSSVKGWHYTEGWHDMDGHYALWFARERKSFEDGDMKRNENQQKVMESRTCQDAAF